MSLTTLHYMDGSGVRRTVTAESTNVLQLTALEVSARVPAYIVTVGDDGGLLVLRYLSGQFLGETSVMPNGPVTQVTLYGAQEVSR